MPKKVRILPKGLSEERMRVLVERAIRFIEERTAAHDKAIEREVGDHLFVNVYRCDVDYMQLKHPGKVDSLSDISKATEVKYWTLYYWLHAAHGRWLLQRAGIDPELGLSHLAEIARLGKDVDAARFIAEWGLRERVGYTRFRRIVGFIKKQRENGVPIEKLVVEPDEPKPKPKPKPRRKRYKKPDRLLLDLLDLLRDWARRNRFEGEARREARRMVAELRRLVQRSR